MSLPGCYSGSVKNIPRILVILTLDHTAEHFVSIVKYKTSDQQFMNSVGG